MTCSLYRHFGKDGTLLYVGISLSPLYRLSQHRAGSEWYSEISRVEIEAFASRSLAEQAERQAIVSERPKHNIAHVVSTDPILELAERVKRGTSNQDIIYICDALLALKKACPVCDARRQAKAASQRKWRARVSDDRHV